MKTNKIFALGALLLSCLAFTACSDDDWSGPGEQESNDNPGVFFTTVNAGSQEVDPADAKTFTVEMKRLNTNGRLTVPLIVSRNDSSVFQVPDSAVFADGDSLTTFTVNYPSAPEGVALTVNIDIPTQYYSLYKDAASGVSFSKTVQVVKWNDAGSGVFTDLTFFDAPGESANVKVQQRDGTNQYRLVSPYHTLSPDDFASTANIVFTLNNDGTIGFARAIYDIFGMSGYQMYYDPVNYGDYCSVTNNDGVIEWNFLILQGSSLYGGGDFKFTWTDGYPLDEE